MFWIAFHYLGSSLYGLIELVMNCVHYPLLHQKRPLRSIGSHLLVSPVLICKWQIFRFYYFKTPSAILAIAFQEAHQVLVIVLVTKSSSASQKLPCYNPTAKIM